MVSSKLRVLAGVSLLALGTVAAVDPAAANVPGVNQVDLDTIAINLIDIDELTPPVVTGAIKSVTNVGGEAAAEALVLCADSATCADSGAFAQYAYGVTSGSNGLVVDGSLTIGADANAQGGSAKSLGYIQFGAWQLAVAEGVAENKVEIAGELDIVASANAVGTASSALALAIAGIGAGISQIATSLGVDGVASNVLDNSGTLNIAAIANADAAAGTAKAVAYISAAIVQTANAEGLASAEIANSGSILIEAGASAAVESGVGMALAAAGGFVQAADGTAEGKAVIDNKGTIAVLAAADVNGESGALAQATVVGGSQLVLSDGVATASIANSGTISISALANAEAADATGNDWASALAAGNGIVQYAAAPQANVEFDNSNTFQLLVEATAKAEEFALATATANAAIYQLASGSMAGVASADIDNSGSILIGVLAEAAGGTTARATAVANTAIFQQAISGGDASAAINNSGSIHVAVEAEALAAGGNSTEFAADSAWAQALAVGINALATVTGVSGDASVELTNSGSIKIDALAHATADADAATVIAQAVSGLMGYADVMQDGNATVGITNEGSISLNAVGSATGQHAGSGLVVTAGAVLAQARVSGEGDATSVITNSGDILLHSLGNARGDTNAWITAIAVNGVMDLAYAANGDAHAELSNSGSIAVIGEGNATALVAEAHAVAGGSLFGGAVVQSAAGYGDAIASLDNAGDITVAALAKADGDIYAYASAVAGLAINQAAYASSGDASAHLTNSGAVEIVGLASAEADSAHAFALFYNGVFNNANSVGGGSAVAEINNEGSIDINVQAKALGVVNGEAKLQLDRAVGANAFAYGAGNASGTLDNSGSIDVVGLALAEGLEGHATASLNTVIFNSAVTNGAGDALGMISNSGSIDLAASASFKASGDEGAAVAKLNAAVIQGVGANAGAALGQIDNSGSLDLLAIAEIDAVGGVATDLANATATAQGIAQYGEAKGVEYGTQTVFGFPATEALVPLGEAKVELTNSGSIDLGVSGKAAADGFAFASAKGELLKQSVSALDAQLAVDNSGSLKATALAVAEAGISAAANGDVVGIFQSATGVASTIHRTVVSTTAYTQTTSTQLLGEVHAAVTNSGSIEVAGLAQAEAAEGPALAEMTVRGLVQDLLGVGTPGAGFANSGEFKVAAKAEATGDSSGSAVAKATGYELTANNANLAFDNSGDFSVIAQATGFGDDAFASAHAVGFTANVEADGVIAGSIENSGELLVTAIADYAGNGSAVAQATGISIGAGSADLSISNSGLINVTALSYGGSADATAIRIVDNGAGAADPAAVITFTNNGGTIIARRSEDGGQSWLRGTAIDASGAPNAAVINLNGTGSIYGDIVLGAGDIINVAGGETSFDGIINPACIGGGACGNGTLNVSGDGALFLRDNGTDGPSAAYVNELNIAGDGTIIFELQGNLESGHPQLFADVANLDGTLLVRATAGLYESQELILIDANTRNGEFDFCGMDGGSALLELTCSYDDDGNVGIGIERVAFNAVDGLTRNQRSVGSGIEAVYDIGLTGPFADMVGQLFTFGNDDYRSALDQLAGANYASYQQSFHALGNRYNQLIDKATECAMPQRAASALDCRTDKVHVWGQLDVGSRRNDGDIEASGYNSDRWTAIVGADALVGPNAVIGASVAKVSDHADYRDGGSINADGYQFGAYATYDPGSFYAKLIGTFSSFDGDAKRSIDWSEFGGDLAGQLKGDPDVRLVTLGLHAGYRVEIGANSLLTPYANVDYSSVRLDDFVETGLAGADLTVDGSTSKRTTVAVGTKWAADLGAVIPQAELGYLYNFGDKRTAFDAAFVGQEDGEFEVISSAEKRGSLLAGLSLGGKAGPVDVRIGYQGLFNGDGAQHNGGIRLTLPLGGK